MTVEPLLTQLAFTRFVVAQNSDAITHKESLRRPLPDASHMNWVVGHIVEGRNGLLKLLGEPPLWSDEENAVYRRGARPAVDGLHRDFAELVALYLGAQDRVTEALQRATPERWRTVAPREHVLRDGMTVGEMAAALVFHEAYHAGQTGVLRRLIGKAGMIR